MTNDFDKPSVRGLDTPRPETQGSGVERENSQRKNASPWDFEDEVPLDVAGVSGRNFSSPSEESRYFGESWKPDFNPYCKDKDLGLVDPRTFRESRIDALTRLAGYSAPERKPPLNAPRVVGENTLGAVNENINEFNEHGIYRPGKNGTGEIVHPRTLDPSWSPEKHRGW